MLGSPGDDQITLTGALPPAHLFGAEGNDTIYGGVSSDILVGGPGRDILAGRQGSDIIYADGDDTVIWNPGDGSDLIQGSGLNNTLVFNCSNISENIALTANGPRLRLTRDVANITIDAGGIQTVNLQTLGGADNITVDDLTGTAVTQVNIDLAAIIGTTNGVAALNIPIILDGGDGDDNITGSDASEIIYGGPGNDIISGGRGNDLVFLGEGNDTFIWNPGDGNDTVEGQGGNDTLQFNGANVAENISISANGSRTRFTRDIANIVMDLDGIENVNFAALGGADNITVNDLTGTAVTQVNIDLGATGGGGDGAADIVTVNGTPGDDIMQVIATGGAVEVTGLPWNVQISHPEAANDTLIVNGLGGTNSISNTIDVLTLIHLFTNP